MNNNPGEGMTPEMIQRIGEVLSGAQTSMGPPPEKPLVLGEWYGYVLVPDMESAHAVVARGEMPLLISPGVSMDTERLGELQQEQWERPGRIFGRRMTGGFGVVTRDMLGRVEPDFQPLYNEETEGPGAHNTRAAFGGGMLGGLR